MAERNTPIRVLVVDDEPEVRDAYRQILLENEVDHEMIGFRELRSRLFKKNPAEALRPGGQRARQLRAGVLRQAEEAVRR